MPTCHLLLQGPPSGLSLSCPHPSGGFLESLLAAEVGRLLLEEEHLWWVPKSMFCVTIMFQ